MAEARDVWIEKMCEAHWNAGSSKDSTVAPLLWKQLGVGAKTFQMDKMRAALAALSAEGLIVVPVEPTETMIAGMRDAWDYFDAGDDVFRREWRGAIAASSPPRAEAEKEKE